MGSSFKKVTWPKRSSSKWWSVLQNQCLQIFGSLSVLSIKINMSAPKMLHLFYITLLNVTTWCNILAFQCCHPVSLCEQCNIWKMQHFKMLRHIELNGTNQIKLWHIELNETNQIKLWHIELNKTNQMLNYNVILPIEIICVGGFII